MAVQDQSEQHQIHQISAYAHLQIYPVENPNRFRTWLEYGQHAPAFLSIYRVSLNRLLIYLSSCGRPLSWEHRQILQKYRPTLYSTKYLCKLRSLTTRSNRIVLNNSPDSQAK